MNIKSFKKDEYDVIIIGAGIGGLVCGCYLSSADAKVLILEQHHNPGGYCSSFERQGYNFDVGVHYLGSCRENGGVLYNILKDLRLLDKIEFLRKDNYNKVVTPNEKFFFSSDKDKTKKRLIDIFPNEKENIKNFFNFIFINDFLTLVSKTKSLTFEKLLNIFFKNYKLKSILSILLGNLGLPPSRASALISVILFREYILDGGYYPKGGIQKLPDLLVAKFKENGGDLSFSTPVESIIVKKGRAAGIILKDKKTISSKVVVSNADAIATFNNLLSFKSREQRRSKTLEISPSAFVIYLGLNKNLEENKQCDFVTWQFYSYDIEQCYNTKKYYIPRLSLRNNADYFKINYIICHFPTLLDKSLAPKNKSIARLMFWVEPSNNSWESHKDYLYEKVTIKLENMIPGFKNFVEVKEIATPFTFKKFTSNNKGAAFGWASIPNQVDRDTFPFNTSINGLYLVGHWVTMGFGHSGIAQVAFCGKTVARELLKKYKNSFN